MSKTDLITEMESELVRLNQVIDLKIIRGLDYRKDSKRHKFLTSQLFDLTAEYRSSNWTRVATLLYGRV